MGRVSVRPPLHTPHTFSALDNFDDWLPEAIASLAVPNNFGGREVGHSFFKLWFDESQLWLRKGLEIL